MSKKVKITLKSGASSDVELTDKELEDLVVVLMSRIIVDEPRYPATSESMPFLLLNDVVMVEKLESMPDPKGVK